MADVDVFYLFSFSMNLTSQIGSHMQGFPSTANHSPPSCNRFCPNSADMEKSPFPAAEESSPPDPDPDQLSRSPDAGEETAAVWDWGNLLDFTIEVEDPFVPPWQEDNANNPQSIARSSIQESSPGSSIQSISTSGEPSRVRKRDPRLVCDNFLAGRVPCACPELDRKAEEEEERAARATAGVRKKVKIGGKISVVRCQVPDCGDDISELKGYHRRHRVCLKCANASSVFLDGESKRYCQQCGK